MFWFVAECAESILAGHTLHKLQLGTSSGIDLNRLEGSDINCPFASIMHLMVVGRDGFLRRLHDAHRHALKPAPKVHAIAG